MTSQITCSPKASPTFDRVDSRLIAIDLHAYGETSLTQSADCFALNDEVRLVESLLTSALRHMAPVTHPALVKPIIERFIRDADGAATPTRHWEALPSESQWLQTAALCP